MSYRGRRHTELELFLEKKSLAACPLHNGVHNRGRGGKYRSYKRKMQKRREAREADFRQEVEELLERARVIEEEAATYLPWCPEAADALMKEADELRERAEEMLDPDLMFRRLCLKYGYTPRKSRKTSETLEAEPLSEEENSRRLEFLQQRARERQKEYSLSRALVKALEEAAKSGEKNFMDGISYRLNPVDTLKMISASSIFGEPQYYRHGDRAAATILDAHYRINELFAAYSLRMLDPYKGMTTSEVMEKAIDDALDADFEAVLRWAVELRQRYLMRLNPQVIIVRAAVHPGRKAFTREHPGEFARIARQVMRRGDDVIAQAEYWLAVNGSKNNLPAILKRAWAAYIGSMNAYTMAKYGNAGIGLKDVVRICHAKGSLVDTLMREGRVPMPEGENTWERLRASGMSWEEIVKTIRMPHMALLRNLRGIFGEVEDPGTREEVLALLKRGVPYGKQFPFRYLSAWKAVNSTKAGWAPMVKDALEECMGIACRNLPALKGRCAFLTDNSGSAWGTCPSEYGTMKIAEIGNLSATIGAMRSEVGIVFPFGDRLEQVRVHEDDGVLQQTHLVTTAGKTCGRGTENGVWLFFRDAILNRQHWDTIFIYSDMQAGHGGLYGMNADDYKAVGACVNAYFIDVNMLIRLYRELVNPRVNVFCIQIAGYTNALVPEYGYRTAILYGWTGRELVFADAMIRLWDEVEGREEKAEERT